MNLFPRKKNGSRPNAPIVALNMLPALKSGYDPAALYIIPRVRVIATGEITHLDNAAHAHSRLWLIGASGGGKSSALQFIAARAGHGAALESFADAPQNASDSLRNDGWILFDDATNAAHSAQLAALAQKYPAAKFAVAAPDAQFAPADFVVLELLPFNEREIIAFAEAWIPLPTHSAHGSKLNRAAQDFFVSAQSNAGTRELATNPLNLFLLMQVYDPAARAPQKETANKIALPVAGSSVATPFDVPQRNIIAALPARRAALFDAYVNAKLARERDPALAARAVEGIALATKRGQPAQAEHLARGSAFLVQRADGSVAFKHALLQAFLAARALRLNPESELLRQEFANPAWRDVILFYAGLGGAEQIATIASEQNDLYLGAAALAAALEPPPALLEQTVKALVTRAWDDHDTRAIHALGELRNNQASDFFAAKLRDKSAEIRLRAAQILGKLHTDRALEYLLPQLRDPSAEVRMQVIASLGQSRSERVIEPLLVALRGDPRASSNDTQLKIAAARALGEFGTDKAAPALLVDMQVNEGELQTEAVRALEKIRSPFAIKPLESIVATDKREPARAAAAQVLKNMQGQ